MTIQPLTVLIAALGGEGGGVLTNWIVGAAQAQGLPVQATSIPGVAQRTGATTYYIEIWPEPVTDARRPVLSLSPAPGEVDIVATTELLEAGRCILNGFVTPERTHLIASTHRVYTTLEKMAVGDGRFDDAALLSAAKERSRSVQLLNLDDVARTSGARISAVLLGMLAAKLPIAQSAFEGAIFAGGKAVTANLRGFAAGLAAAEQHPANQAALEPDALIAEGEKRLLGYQGKAYARLYRERLNGIDDANVLGEVAKGLFRRMAYADIIRVAQLKTRANRLAEITGKAADDQAVNVTEYFRPSLREVCDILPRTIAARVLAWADAKPQRLQLSWPMALRSSTLSGFLMLRLLAGLRVLRPWSHRYQREQAAIDAWLSDIRGASPALALERAKNARLIKGYGVTYERTQAAFDGLRRLSDVEAIAEARNEALAERPAL